VQYEKKKIKCFIKCIQMCFCFIAGSSDQIPSLYLFVYAYGVMLMKNGVYFCAVLIVLLKRKVGNKKESA